MAELQGHLDCQVTARWTDIWEGHPAHNGLHRPWWHYITDTWGLFITAAQHNSSCLILLINVGFAQDFRGDKKSQTLQKWKELDRLIVDSPGAYLSPNGKNQPLPLCLFLSSNPATKTLPGCQTVTAAASLRPGSGAPRCLQVFWPQCVCISFLFSGGDPGICQATPYY